MQGCNLATVDRNRVAAAPLEGACGPTTHSRATDGPQGTLGKNRERNFFFCAEAAPLRLLLKASKHKMDFSLRSATRLDCLIRGPASVTIGTNSAPTTIAVRRLASVGSHIENEQKNGHMGSDSVYL